jgi:transcriptional regulator with XRE-family HTH domain
MRERRRHGWSREYVAEHIEVSPYTVGQWERGEQSPIPNSLQKLCELFGKMPEELGLISEEFLSPEQPDGTFCVHLRLKKSVVIDSFLGKDQSDLLTVLVSKSTIHLYINTQFEAQVCMADGTSVSGKIAFLELESDNCDLQDIMLIP